jgi:hypothetical protein
MEKAKDVTPARQAGRRGLYSHTGSIFDNGSDGRIVPGMNDYPINKKRKPAAYYEGNEVIPNHIHGVVRYILWTIDNTFSWGVRRKVAGCHNVYIARNDWKADGDGRSTWIICHPLIR